MDVKERRKHPRVKKHLRVVLYRKRFFFLWEGRDVAELVDISVGGAQVNTKRLLQQGDKVVVTIQPRSFSPVIHFDGKIIWVRTRHHQDRKYLQIGIQFRKLGPLQRAVMKRLSGAAVTISPA